jgi:protein-tyrosine phosphatase
MVKVMPQRLVHLEGSHNFRDIGGYATPDGGQTRSGLIYRSDALDQLTRRDQARLAQLGIATIFDLREQEEVDAYGKDRVWDGVRVIRAPTTLLDDGLNTLVRDAGRRRMVDYYQESMAPRLAYHARLFTAIVEHIAKPLVIHCSAGKDRTGVMIALLLRLVGVTEADIVADYAETTSLMEGRFAQEKIWLGQQGLPKPVLDDLFGAPPETMQALLKYMDARFGSVEDYLKQGGVTAAQIERFKAAFVVPRGQQ